MDVLKSSFVLRERKFWESTDFAVLMFRRFLPVIACCFGTMYIAISLAVLFTLGPTLQILPALIVWWLKPLWERIIIAPIGLLFFNPEANAKSIFVSMKRVFSIELLSSLTIFRFSFRSAFLSPVDMYEHPARSARKARRQWLCRGIDGQLFSLAAMFFVLDLLVFLSIYLGIMVVVSASMVGTHDSQFKPDYIVLTLSWIAALLVTEPLYALSAFALYINRRTVHEGWDLRLEFGKLGNRPTEKPRKTIFFSIIFLCFFFQGFETHSLDAAPPPKESYEARLERIIRDPEFGETKKVTVLRFKEEPERETGTTDMSVPSFFVSANILRALAILGGSIIVVFLLVFLIRRYGGREKKEKVQAPKPSVRIAQPDKEKRDRLLGEALDEWNKGDERGALSCLYQVGISLATKRYKVRLPDSATEGTCLMLVGRSGARQAFVELFARITGSWMQVSWSDRTIDYDRFEELYKDLKWEHDIE
jgi:hypothetical protein